MQRQIANIASNVAFTTVDAFFLLRSNIAVMPYSKCHQCVTQCNVECASECTSSKYV